MSEVSEDVKESLSLIEDLKFFLATAPANWQENQVIRRYYLNNDEGFVSCVFWNNLYFITGTDIVRCILYKFQHFGRTVTDRKKFEEGIFSDLRNMKTGTDSVLENPKSEFLEFLYKNSCLRTQKKQKVFFWFNVNHDKLMADALERDLKREKAGQPATSVASREPATSFEYKEDLTKSLFEQLTDHIGQPQFGTSIKSEDHTKTNTPDCSTSPENSNLGLSHEPEHHMYSEHAKNKRHNTLNEAGTSFDTNDDDDFPLDYLDKDFHQQEFSVNEGAAKDYITLDSNHHTGAFINAGDTNFDNLESSIFPNPINLVSNEDYLIEQTVPVRMTNSANQLYFPRSAKYYDEHPFMHQPIGYAPGMQYSPSAIMPPFGFPLEQGYHHFHDVPSIYSHLPYDGEFYHSQMTPLAALHPMIHMEPASSAIGFGFPEEFDYNRNPHSAQRQQEITASMMRKRRQLQNARQSNKVTKPSRSFNATDLEGRFRVQIKQENGDSLIPTPESSNRVSANIKQQHFN